MFSDLPYKMTHKFEVDFDQDWIKGEGAGIERSAVCKNCFEFELKEKEGFDPSSVQLQRVKVIKKPWLYGPATCLQSRTIVYPCSRFMCSVPCPCLLCHKKHPSCRDNSCGCQDCTAHFSDHENFHATFHFGCKSCFQLVNLIPCFNYFFLGNERKERKNFWTG